MKEIKKILSAFLFSHSIFFYRVVVTNFTENSKKVMTNERRNYNEKNYDKLAELQRKQETDHNSTAEKQQKIPKLTTKQWL